MGKRSNEKTIKIIQKKKPGQIFHLTTTGLPENLIRVVLTPFFQARKYPEPIFACPRNCSNKCNVHDRDKKSKFYNFISSKSISSPYWQICGKFLRPFYWKTHPSKNHEYLFSFFSILKCVTDVTNVTYHK